MLIILMLHLPNHHAINEEKKIQFYPILSLVYLEHENPLTKILYNIFLFLENLITAKGSVEIEMKMRKNCYKSKIFSEGFFFHENFRLNAVQKS